MTKEQFNKLMTKEMDVYSDKAMTIYGLEDWIRNRAIIVEFMKNMDSLVEVYNMENKE